MICALGGFHPECGSVLDHVKQLPGNSTFKELHVGIYLSEYAIIRRHPLGHLTKTVEPS